MTAASAHEIVACHDCDLLIRMLPLRTGERAMCSRCGAVLYRKKRESFEIPITLTITSLIFFILANVFPFMTFKLQGRVQESLLATGIKEFWLQGMWPLAIVVLLFTILFPSLKIFGMLYVLGPLEYKRKPWKGILVFRMVDSLHTWAMTDVYLLGVIVAVVKLMDLATIIPGTAVYSFAALIFVMAAADANLDTHAVWDKLGPTSWDHRS